MPFFTVRRIKLKKLWRWCSRCCCCCFQQPDEQQQGDDAPPPPPLPEDNAAAEKDRPLSSTTSECNSHLCRSCRDILSRDVTDDLVKVLTGVDSVEYFAWEERKIRYVGQIGTLFDPECPLCRELALCQSPKCWEEHQNAPPETVYTFEKYLRSEATGGYSLGVNVASAKSPFKGLVKVGLCPEPDASASLGPFSSNTGSERSWQLVSEWMARCKLTHQICNPAPLEIPPLPTRVIDIGSEIDDFKPRVVIVTDDTPLAPYATLSHAWGTDQPLKLLEGNLETLTEAIPEEELCKTFLDAITATRRLKLRYLWIDALCIIQDSKEDWQEEAARMTEVYSNSYCNISATSAADGTQGCFSERDPSLVSPVRINVGWGPRSGDYYAIGSHAFPRNVSAAPLHLRAWAAQERLLAPRNIQCGSTQLFWDCCELVASESFPLALPNGSDLELRGLDSSKVILPEVEGRRMRRAIGARPDASLEVFAVWNRIVKSFSACKLTYPTDKLVALSGLAAKMHEFTGCEYLAGMWRRHLAYQLLWTTISRESVGGSEYIAPSWSWASSPNPVLQPSEVWFGDEREIMVEIIDAKTYLVDQRYPFGQVTEGSITIKGVLLKNTDNFTLTPDDGTGGTSDPWVCINGLVLCRPRMDLAAYEKGAHNLYYLPIRYASTRDSFEMYQPDISGLVLEEIGDGQDMFRRVGQFEIHAGGYWFYDVGALEDFQVACYEANGETDEGPFPDWGKRRTFTIV